MRTTTPKARAEYDTPMFAGGLLLAVVVLFASTSPVTAENRGGAFNLSPFFGGQGFPFAPTHHYDADFYWGARAGYNFTRHIGAELVFGQNNTVRDPEVADCTVWQYGADVLYYFRPEKQLVISAAVGFGDFDVKFDDPEPFSDHVSTYFNYGVGLDFALQDWLDFRTDFRHAIMLDRGEHVFSGSVGFRFQF